MMTVIEDDAVAVKSSTATGTWNGNAVKETRTIEETRTAGSN
jgi:hypothetical protein